MLTQMPNTLPAAIAAENYFGFDPGEWFAIGIILIGCVTAIIITAVTMISGTMERMHRSRQVADLKREMLDRGMAADEIAKVIEAAPPNDFLERWASNQGSRKRA